MALSVERSNLMKKSVQKLLATVNSGGKVSRQVHQSTIEHAVMNGWIVWTGENYKITDAGYLAYLRSA